MADAILFRRARIKLPTRPGAGDEAALYVAEATDRTQARAEIIEILDQLVQGLTA